jgi:hypothetical protein
MKLKKILLTIAFFLTTVAMNFGQSKGQELSNADKFSAKAGALIQKEYLDVGTVNKAKIKVIHYKDLISSETASAVRLQYEIPSSYSTDIKIASLDADEIDGLIKSIKLMQEKVFVSTPTNYTEFTYKSRGNFEAGCYWKKGDWEAYLKLDKFDGLSYVLLKKDDFPTLVNLLEKAQTMLK